MTRHGDKLPPAGGQGMAGTDHSSGCEQALGNLSR
jgi:hypothetical protein